MRLHTERKNSLEAQKRAIMGMLEEGEKDAFETFLATSFSKYYILSDLKKAPPG